MAREKAADEPAAWDVDFLVVIIAKVEEGVAVITMEAEVFAGANLEAASGMPPEVVNRIQADVVKVLAMPEVKTKLTDLGVDLSGMKPAEFSAYLKSEMTRYAKVIQDNNIKPD